MTDILGMGTSFNFKGKISGYYYEGLLFEKNMVRSTHFHNGRHFVIDVKDLSDTEIIESYGVDTFSNDDVPIANLKGDKYLVIEGKPRFGRITTLEDLRGTQ